MIEILKLGQIWPDGYRDNKYWIGVTLANVQHMGQPPVLGQECSTLVELEAVAQRIRMDLDRVLAEARKKFGENPS